MILLGINFFIPIFISERIIFFGVFDMGKKIKVKDLVQEGRSIHEKFNKKINEAPFGNEPGGMMSPDGQSQYANFNELVKDYAMTRYEADQGTSSEDVVEAERNLENMEREIIKMKGASYFELVEVLGTLYVYLNEYAGPVESPKVKKSIIRICKRLGIPPGDYA